MGLQYIQFLHLVRIGYIIHLINSKDLDYG